jgi:hypothetical protein
MKIDCQGNIGSLSCKEFFMNSGYWNWNIFFPSQVVGNNPDMGQDGH